MKKVVRAVSLMLLMAGVCGRQDIKFYNKLIYYIL